MGMTPLDGVPMGTRSGQIDPGVLFFLMKVKGMSVKEVSDLIHHNSGLKGLSGLSQDMRVLEASDSPSAKEAIDYFVYRIRREIGSLAAALDGLDAIVFTGGIGENSPAHARRGADRHGVARRPSRQGGEREPTRSASQPRIPRPWPSW